VSARELREKVKVSEARSGREPTEVTVGVLGRAHGIKGEVAIDLRTDEPDRRFADGAILRIEDTDKTMRVVSTRWHGGRPAAPGS
jgi:16S rRNA processing protein RimM